MVDTQGKTVEIYQMSNEEAEKRYGKALISLGARKSLESEMKGDDNSRQTGNSWSR